MERLTEAQLQDMANSVYDFVVHSFTQSMEEQTELGDTTKEVIKIASSVSSLAVVAAYKYLENLEGGKRNL